MTDGYEPHNELARANDMVHLGCWAKARRYLIGAEHAIPKPQRAERLLTGFITRSAHLFAVEAKAQEAGITPVVRQRLCEAPSRPHLPAIEELLQRHLPTVLRQSLFGKVLHYLRGQWPKLIRCLDDSAWPLSNNPCENAIRPYVVGRRNWQFSDTIGGATASANLHPLIETVKANGVDTCPYLVALCKALPYARTADDHEALLPWRLTPAADRSAGSLHHEPCSARLSFGDRLHLLNQCRHVARDHLAVGSGRVPDAPQRLASARDEVELLCVHECVALSVKQIFITVQASDRVARRGDAAFVSRFFGTCAVPRSARLAMACDRIRARLLARTIAVVAFATLVIAIPTTGTSAELERSVPEPHLVWPDGVYRWRYNPERHPSWMSTDEARAYVKQAAIKWEACGVRMQFLGDTELLPGTMDGENVVGWTAELPRGIRGLTQGRAKGGQLVERDIVFAAEREEFKRYPRLLEKVLVHEFGHAIGLRHSRACDDVMTLAAECPRASPASLPLTPTANDLARCRDAYPRAAR